MHWASIGLILVAGLDIGVALLIWLRNYRNKINQSFALMLLFLAVWTFGCAMFREAPTAEAVMLWVRTLNVGGIILIVPFLLFSIYFPFQTYQLTGLLKTAIFLPMFGVLIVLFIPDVWFSPSSIIINPPHNNFRINFGYYIFTLYFLIFIGWAYYNLIRKYLSSEGFTRSQLKLIIAGTSIASFFGTLFGAISPLLYEAKYFWIGPYFSLPMIVYLVYFAFYYRSK